MKIKHLINILSCLFVLSMTVILSSCSKDDDEYDIKEIVMEIDSEADIYTDIVDHTTVPGMWIKTEGYRSWYIYPQNLIEGFDFEEGYYCKLLVEQKTIKEELYGASPSYRLLKVMEKKASESVRK